MVWTFLGTEKVPGFCLSSAQKVSIGVSIEAEQSGNNFSFVGPLQLLIPLDSSLLPTPYSLLPTPYKEQKDFFSKP